MDKATCDACGKEVGVASLYKRIGFVGGSRIHQVCGTCYKDKLNRDERLRFAKPAAKKAKKAPEDDWKPASQGPPDDLRFGG